MTVYDATPLTGKPGGGAALPGCVAVAMPYGYQADGGGYWQDGAEHDRVLALPTEERVRSLPDEQRVKALAKSVRFRGVYVIHLEEVTSWVPDLEADIENHAHEYRAYGQVARWVRDARPDLRIGLWTGTPYCRQPASGGDPTRFERCLPLWLEHTVPHIDFIADGFYVFYDTDMNEWSRWLEWHTEAVRGAGKPQIPFLNLPDIEDPYNARLAVKAITSRFDMGIWCNPRPYDRKADAAWRGLLS